MLLWVFDPSFQGTFEVEAHAKWLVCKDICIPGEARLKHMMAAPSEESNIGVRELFETYASLVPSTSEAHPEFASLTLVSRLREHQMNKGVVEILFSDPNDLPGIVAERLQLFPLSNDEYSFGAPHVSKLSTSDNFVIHVPLCCCAEQPGDGATSS